MNAVTVAKEDLLKALKKNRREHRATFLKAQEGYREEAIKVLDGMLMDAKKGKVVRQYIGLVAPTDQTRDYDRAISMIEMSVEEKIVLSERDFAQYVLDDWAWKEQFVTTSSNYIK